MAYIHRNDLLAPYLALDQGSKVQAECTPPRHLLCMPHSLIFPLLQTFGLMVTVVFAQKQR